MMQNSMSGTNGIRRYSLRGLVSTDAAILILIIGLVVAGYLLFDMHAKQQSYERRAEARSLAQAKIDEFRGFKNYSDLLHRLNPGLQTDQDVSARLPAEGAFPRTAESITGQHGVYKRQWTVKQDGKSSIADVTVTWRDDRDDQPQRESVSTSFIWAFAQPVQKASVETTGKSIKDKPLRIIPANRVATVHSMSVADKPLTAKGPVLVGKAAVTLENPNGHTTIWSGGVVKLGASKETLTRIANPSDKENYPGCLWNKGNCRLINASTNKALALDVIDMDSKLAQMSDSDFFFNTFGMPLAQFRQEKVDIHTQDADFANEWNAEKPGAKHADGKVIWAEGKIAIRDISLGCESGALAQEKATIQAGCVKPEAENLPSVLIVNGDLILKGGVNIYGVVYVTGNLVSYGDNTIRGAVIVAKTAQLVKGSIDIRYDRTVRSLLKDESAKVAVTENAQ